LAIGLGAGWLLALVFALVAAGREGHWAAWGPTLAASLGQCLPAAVLGLVLLAAGVRGSRAVGGAVGLLLFSRLYGFVRNILADALRAPHVILARAKGLSRPAVFRRHVLPSAAGELMALGGASVSMALSALIPMEMILDVAGIGQLAWQAALARDLTLLVNITVVVSLAVTLANTAADWMGRSGTAREVAR
jgi:peptide/nickel transport system permease protein